MQPRSGRGIFKGDRMTSLTRRTDSRAHPAGDHIVRFLVHAVKLVFHTVAVGDIHACSVVTDVIIGQGDTTHGAERLQEIPASATMGKLVDKLVRLRVILVVHLGVIIPQPLHLVCRDRAVAGVEPAVRVAVHDAFDLPHDGRFQVQCPTGAGKPAAFFRFQPRGMVGQGDRKGDVSRYDFIQGDCYIGDSRTIVYRVRPVFLHRCRLRRYGDNAGNVQADLMGLLRV